MRGFSAIRRRPSSERLKILFIAYPLLAVSEASAGGAEQVLWTLERTLHTMGHDTWVAASSGSQISGKLVETGEPGTDLDALEDREVRMRETVLELLQRDSFDCIHDMSGSWWKHAQGVEEPVLATLHLPRSYYAQNTFSEYHANVSFNCVSLKQRESFADLPRMLAPVPNGIALERFLEKPPMAREERSYLLWLGRVCEEKGPHSALDVAFAAQEKLILAGKVYPFLYHQKFYAREVLPRIRRSRHKAKLVMEPSFVEKLSLLRHAKALLITSTAPETSSIVAMEAAACGTPVLALDTGAVREVVRESVTGWLARDLEHLRSLLSLLPEIDPEACVRYAQHNFSARAMAERYIERYRTLLGAEQQTMSVHS